MKHQKLVIVGWINLCCYNSCSQKMVKKYSKFLSFGWNIVLNVGSRFNHRMFIATEAPKIGSTYHTMVTVGWTSLWWYSSCSHKMVKIHSKILNSFWNIALNVGSRFHHLMVIAIEAPKIGSTNHTLVKSVYCCLWWKKWQYFVQFYI